MQADFTELEEAFFREGDALADLPPVLEVEEAPRPSLWQRMFKRPRAQAVESYYAAYELA